ncbi:hypothetical protein EJ03DRAFT_348161 [Teratosphaeria nubilosa]|uniref:MFS general substrate transporter n=1 Tax=Teratosphaeria nubilosa TaxID=161662 RepID=A0A6G1LKM2_9PEZI|nr:hypothetical protein EJ03DRAFT_348161 [Teratosphaeria nubilosa]
MDWSGSVTSVAGLVLVNVAWNNGPLYGWGVPYVYFILIIGVLVLGASVWVEMRAESPLLPVRVFNGTIGWAMLLIVIGWGSFGIWIWYSYRFLMDVRGLSPLTVSVEYVPAIICGLLAAGTTGGLITHTPVPFVMMLAMVAFCVGAAISTFQPVHQTYWAQMFVSIIIMPFGMDMSFPAATVIMSNQMPAEHQGPAASLVNALVNYSVSIFLGVAGTWEVSVTHRESTPAADAWGVQCARYTGFALSALGVVLGAIFFAQSFWQEGWKVMEH